MKAQWSFTRPCPPPDSSDQWNTYHPHHYPFAAIPAPRIRLPPHRGCKFRLPMSYILLMLPVTSYCWEHPFSPSSNHHSPQGPFLMFTTHWYLRDLQTRAHTHQIKLYWTTATLHWQTVHTPPSTAELSSRHRNHMAHKTYNICSLALYQTSLPAPDFFNTFTKHALRAKHGLCPEKRTRSTAKLPPSAGNRAVRKQQQDRGQRRTATLCGWLDEVLTERGPQPQRSEGWRGGSCISAQSENELRMLVLK